MNFARTLAAALLLAAALPAAHAQDLQAGKPIRMIVGLAAGGGTDVMARLVAAKMSDNMKQTVIVENKAGGNFIPALRELTSSPPDGHTLFFISTSTLITQPLHQPDYPFDLTKLTPVTQVATGPLIMVVKNSLNMKTLKEVVDFAKANPGKLTFGAGGGTGIVALFRHRTPQVQGRHQPQHRELQGRGPCAQRPARRPHRRHVRRHAGDGAASQGGQGNADRGDQRQALGRVAERADHQGVRLSRLRDVRLVRHPGAGRHAAGDRAEAARRGRESGCRSGRDQNSRTRRAWSRSPPSRPIGAST